MIARRHILTAALLLATAAAATAFNLAAPPANGAGPLKGKIRKCLKWGMVQDKSLPLVEAFRMTRYFLDRHVYEPRGLEVGTARDGFIRAVLDELERLPAR